ncbi:MAG: preprotein translocase subunit YajC [Prevotellaceae bacterium]|nr:preprotein translocase subunit YajC [Candidatus Faecinaster equi]
MVTNLFILLQAQGNAAGGGLSFWIMIIAIFAIMYFFMIRPQKKKQKEIENFRKSLQVGNQVITSSGVHGTIRKIDEANNLVVLEIAKGVEVTIEKTCIYASASDASADVNNSTTKK